MEKKTMQTLFREVFNLLKRHEFGGREFLVNTGLSNVLMPALIQPIKLYGLEMSMGLSINHRCSAYVFYLFDNPVPTSTDFIILYEGQGGKIEKQKDNVTNYINAPLTRRHEGSLISLQEQENMPPVLKNYHLPISLIEGEIGKLLASGTYLLNKKVKPEKVENLTELIKDDFKLSFDFSESTTCY